MCGIAGGIVAPQEQDGWLARMVPTLSHRGPDDRGEVCFEVDGRRVGLGSTRLAILDLSPAGHMPMRDPVSGNWIVFNGEIYNFRQLRAEMQDEAFTSGSDTEVILKGYRRWGRGIVDRLRGMFAFAIWDQSCGELFLARDRLGEKPLYHHTRADGTFLFASEVRGLLASWLVERRLDGAAVEGYLANGFLCSPATAVAGVGSLLPGHWMRVARDGRVIEKASFWRPEPAAAESDPRAGLQDALTEAVRMRLVSDVPIGAFLSGGLDSSILVALMAQAGSRVRTFSVTFDESGYDESAYSSWVARRFATQHSEVRLRAADFDGWIPEAVDAMDQPSFDGVNTYCVARAAKATGLTVALSGLGADEIFGGYPFFRTAPVLRAVAAVAGRVPSGLRRPLEARLMSRGLRVAAPWKLSEAWDGRRDGVGDPLAGSLAAYQATQLLFPSWVRARLLMPSRETDESAYAYGLPSGFLRLLEYDSAASPQPNALSLLALRLFLGERCLRDTDAMSMAVSLEVRSVFTDRCFLERALAVPAERRCQGAPHKPFLRGLFRDQLGDGYPARKKQGFRLPLEGWLRGGGIARMIEETLTDRALTADVGLEAGAVGDLLAAYRRGAPRIPWSRIWALYVLVRWCQRNRVSR